MMTCIFAAALLTYGAPPGDSANSDAPESMDVAANEDRDSDSLRIRLRSEQGLAEEITRKVRRKLQERRRHRDHDRDRDRDHDWEAHISSDGIVRVGESYELAAGEELEEAVVIGGDLKLHGRVRGDAVAVGGSIDVEPGAVVMGDAVAVGGEVTVAPGGEVEGDRVSIGGSLGSLIATAVALGIETDGDFPTFLFTVLATLIQTMALFVVALLLLALLPDRMRRIQDFLQEKPESAVIAGVILLVGFAPLCLLLLVSLIGIPLIPVAVLALVALLTVGMSALATWLGGRMPVLAGRKTPVLAMALGVVLIAVVSLLPMVGTLMLFFASFVAAGAVVASRFGAKPKAGGAAPQASKPSPDFETVGP